LSTVRLNRSYFTLSDKNKVRGLSQNGNSMQRPLPLEAPFQPFNPSTLQLFNFQPSSTFILPFTFHPPQPPSFNLSTLQLSTIHSICTSHLPPSTFVSVITRLQRFNLLTFQPLTFNSFSTFNLPPSTSCLTFHSPLTLQYSTFNIQHPI
jgi:hypothetical protein